MERIRQVGGLQRRIAPGRVFRKGSRAVAPRWKRTPVVKPMAAISLPWGNAKLVEVPRKSQVPRVAVDLSRDLQHGDSGFDVSVMQKEVLKMQPTGVYDDRTLKEVMSWQEAQGLPVTGYFGPMSRQAAIDEAAISHFPSASTMLHATQQFDFNVTTTQAAAATAAPPRGGAPFLAMAGVVAAACVVGVAVAARTSVRHGQQRSGVLRAAAGAAAAVGGLWQSFVALILRTFGLAKPAARPRPPSLLASRARSRQRAIKADPPSWLSESVANNAVEFSGRKAAGNGLMMEMFEEEEGVYASADEMPEYPYNRISRQTQLYEGYRLRREGEPELAEPHLGSRMAAAAAPAAPVQPQASAVTEAPPRPKARAAPPQPAATTFTFEELSPASAAPAEQEAPLPPPPPPARATAEESVAAAAAAAAEEPLVGRAGLERRLTRAVKDSKMVDMLQEDLASGKQSLDTVKSAINGQAG
eukprot:CAMPEP_0118927980 /NCGR_PEP_ID=MMETSP1169-20130426/5348_1 /TAXON_ID=36882 /ORGANISM="Pyramimonas obovata, Strain CCMP722" /LENGTH=471 /DNA_ID=CAMNT_0006869867 /DNA_START=175 /DNA_END=1587 /DNA_ORIENTATION=-